MKIGMNFLLWTHFVEEKHFGLFRELKKIGFDGVEIPLPVGLGDANHYKKIREAADDEGLIITCTSKGRPEAFISSLDKKNAEKGVENLKKVIEYGAILGTPVIGGPFYCSNVFSGNSPTDEEIKVTAENLNKVLDFSKAHNIRLAAEFLNRFECYLLNTVKQAKKLVQEVNHSSFGIHYDTHHANIEESSIEEAFSLGGKDIFHVHFSESHRGILGQGLVDWEANLKGVQSIGYDSCLVIEAFSSKVEILRPLTNMWRDDLFSSELEFAEKSLSFIQGLFRTGYA